MKIDLLPIGTYIRAIQGEGYIIDRFITRQVVINMSRRAKTGKRVNTDDLLAVYDNKSKVWINNQ